MAIDWFARVKQGYDLGFYDNADVATFVIKGRITEEQYKLITGEDFQA